MRDKINIKVSLSLSLYLSLSLSFIRYYAFIQIANCLRDCRQLLLYVLVGSMTAIWLIILINVTVILMTWLINMINHPWLSGWRIMVQRMKKILVKRGSSCYIVDIFEYRPDTYWQYSCDLYWQNAKMRILYLCIQCVSRL